MSYYDDDPRNCPDCPPPRQGFGAGDMVARVTGFFGIKPCKPCERRRQWLNQRLWFGPRPSGYDPNDPHNAPR